MSGLRKYQHRGRCSRLPPTVPRLANLRRRRFAGRLGHRREARAHKGMLRNLAKQRERAHAQSAAGHRVDSLKLLESVEIDQRARRGELLLEQVERVDAAGERHMPRLREQAHGCGQIGGRHDSKRFTLSDRPSNFSQRRQHPIGRDREIAYRHTDRVVHRASDRRG